MSWAHRKLVPASGAGLDFREIEAERVKTRGNVTAAARRFGVPPQDLRKLAW